MSGRSFRQRLAYGPRGYEKVNLATIEKYYSKVEEMRERLKKSQQEHHDPIKLEDLLTKAEK